MLRSAHILPVELETNINPRESRESIDALRYAAAHTTHLFVFLDTTSSIHTTS